MRMAKWLPKKGKLSYTTARYEGLTWRKKCRAGGDRQIFLNASADHISKFLRQKRLFLQVQIFATKKTIAIF